MTLQEIVTEVRRLPDNEQCDLVDLLLADVVGMPDPHNDAVWRAETRRRVAEIESGAVEGIPGDVVMEELRKIVEALRSS
jgi:putative addiction module component (TIGR02574 family)